MKPSKKTLLHRLKQSSNHNKVRLQHIPQYLVQHCQSTFADTQDNYVQQHNIQTTIYNGQNRLQPKHQPTHYYYSPSLNPTATSFIPRAFATPNSVAPETEHLAWYLVFRDLVSTSLYQFNDKPESYRAWHSSFHNATSDIGLTANEMLDLLVKWLGSESGKHVKRIRSDVSLQLPTKDFTKKTRH